MHRCIDALVDESEMQANIVFLHENVSTEIIDGRWVEACKFIVRWKLYEHDTTSTKEQTILAIVMTVGQNMKNKICKLNKRWWHINRFIFHEFKLAT